MQYDYDAETNGQYGTQPSDQPNGKLNDFSFSPPVESATAPAESSLSLEQLADRIRQLEEQAKQVSAPFVMETVLREVAEARVESVKAAERTYNDIVKSAEQESARLRAEAEQEAAQTLQRANDEFAETQRKADELLAQATKEADSIRRGAREQRSEVRQELERIYVDFSAYVEKLMERTKDDAEPTTLEAEPTAAATAPSGAEPFFAPPAISSSSTSSPADELLADLSQASPSPSATTESESPAFASSPTTVAEESRDRFRLPSWLPN